MHDDKDLDIIIAHMVRLPKNQLLLILYLILMCIIVSRFSVAGLIFSVGMGFTGKPILDVIRLRQICKKPVLARCVSMNGMFDSLNFEQIDSSAEDDDESVDNTNDKNKFDAEEGIPIWEYFVDGKHYMCRGDSTDYLCKVDCCRTGYICADDPTKFYVLNKSNFLAYAIFGVVDMLASLIIGYIWFMAN